MIFPAAAHNSLADIPGLRLGHADRRNGGYLTGTTVLLAPNGGMVAGVDVRGGSPGTRETDLLHPTATIQRIHAIVLTGGSAFGLAAAGGVTDGLAAAGIGFAVGPPGDVVPIVPAAVLFDLGRGGSFLSRPDAGFGTAALTAALTDGDDPRLGSVGAGVGAVSAGLKGGTGMASATTPDGSVVAALVVANAVGSPVDPRTGELLGARNLLPQDHPELATPTDDDRRALLTVTESTGPRLQAPSPSITNTSIGIVATTATLTKAQCTKMAGTAHDGLARALNPVHTAFDGDTLFAVATGEDPVPDEIGLHHILCAAADVVTRALVRGLLAAQGVRAAGGAWSSYLDLAPSALRH